MNKVMMLGRIVADPETRTLENGVNVCSFRIAVDRRTKDSDGNKVADFFNCVAWRSTADFLSQYASKGRLVAIDGHLQSRNYTANDGSKRTAIDIQVDNVDFCDSTKGKAESQSETQSTNKTYYADTSLPNDDGELPF